MPDTFDVNGLVVQSLTELVAGLTTALESIYGSDINLDSNSPDGQLVNIVAQAGEDLREILLLLNSGFDPDQAAGTVLDQRLALNGVTRHAGTFTTVEVTLTASQALSLVGLDTQSGIVDPVVPDLYILRDDAGGQWFLVDSQTIGAAGTYTYLFQAQNLGAVQVLANTIQTPVTIVPGITGVNNATGAVTQGVNEETDAEAKIRRRQSVAISSTGYDDSVEAALLALPGVTTAIVYDNNTGATDGLGTPAHTIWCIVEGGVDASIAAVIFAKRSGGCGMRGNVTFPITRANGQIFTAAWDVPTDVAIYVEFTISLPGGSVDTSALAQDIVDAIIWGVGQDAIGSTITAYLLSLNSGYRVSGMGLSTDNITFVENLISTSPANRFIMDVSRFAIS